MKNIQIFLTSLSLKIGLCKPLENLPTIYFQLAMSIFNWTFSVVPFLKATEKNNSIKRGRNGKLQKNNCEKSLAQY